MSDNVCFVIPSNCMKSDIVIAPLSSLIHVSCHLTFCRSKVFQWTSECVLYNKHIPLLETWTCLLNLKYHYNNIVCTSSFLNCRNPNIDLLYWLWWWCWNWSFVILYLDWANHEWSVTCNNVKIFYWHMISTQLPETDSISQNLL